MSFNTGFGLICYPESCLYQRTRHQAVRSHPCSLQPTCLLYSKLLLLQRFPASFPTLCCPFLHVGISLTPSDHYAKFLCSEQVNPATKSIATEQWIRLILSYSRHKKLFLLRVEDAETVGSDWDEILRNERINRTCSFVLLISCCLDSWKTGKIQPSHLSNLMETMVAKNQAAYEPPKQTRSVLIYWRLPEEWAEVLYDWVCNSLFCFPFSFLISFDCIGGLDGTTEYHPDILGHN